MIRRPRLFRRFLALLALYLVLCCLAGILVGEGAVHPQRRPLPPEAESIIREIAATTNSEVRDGSIVTRDGKTLRASLLLPHASNGGAVILLHGLSDNRLGMIGYAQLLTAHGYAVLLPDARAHGASDSDLATYGILERNDIRQWFELLALRVRPRCIFGLGESMGGAQLLQSLAVEPHFCSVIAESPFASLREIAYDRVGQPLHLGPWFGRTVLRPAVEFAFVYVRLKYGLNVQCASPEDVVAATSVPVLLIHGQIDSNIPLRHSLRIRSRNPNAAIWVVPSADHCGAISTAPKEFQQRVFTWFSSHKS